MTDLNIIFYILLIISLGFFEDCGSEMSQVPNVLLPLREGDSPIIKKTEVHRDIDIRTREEKIGRP